MVIYPRCYYHILETIILYPNQKRFDVIEYSGYAKGTVEAAVPWLRKFDLIVHRAGIYIPTEKGRIVWALWKGKQKRKCQ